MQESCVSWNEGLILVLVPKSYELQLAKLFLVLVGGVGVWSCFSHNFVCTLKTKE